MNYIHIFISERECAYFENINLICDSDRMVTYFQKSHRK
jgi:hypothetical protein